jgi:interferon-induced GTP-binding protein Mx
MSSISPLNGFGDKDYDSDYDDVKADAPSIGSSFEGLIRPLINIIDQLRATGIEKDLGLPTIAVMGDQSSGKSSVLEAISGIPLPRGSDIITRCPLEMRMEKASKWSGQIQFTMPNQSEVKWDLNSPDEVPAYIERATNMLAGPGKGVSDAIISMRIRSPEAPDLTLIDLPGIVHSVEKHQSDEVIAFVENLIKKYMMQPRTIMLCLYPACVEVANCVIFRMANQYDPAAKRTIAVITKPDLVADKEQKVKVSNRIYKGGVYNIKEFYIVRSRTPSELAMRLSRKALFEKEAKFFDEDLVFKRIDPEIRGFPSLIRALTKKLVKTIQEDLPGIRNEVNSMLRESQLSILNYQSLLRHQMQIKPYF